MKSYITVMYEVFLGASPKIPTILFTAIPFCFSSCSAIMVYNPTFVVVRPISREQSQYYAEPVEGPRQRRFFAAHKVIIDLDSLKWRDVSITPSITPGVWDIRIPTNSTGKVTLEDWSGKHIGEMIGIWVDNKCASVPVIADRFGGPLTISGNFSEKDAQMLQMRILRGGAVIEKE